MPHGGFWRALYSADRRRRAHRRQSELVVECQLVAVPLRVHDQGVFHRPGDVVVEVVAGVEEQLGDELLVVVGRNHQVDMGRTPGVPATGREKTAERAIVRDRVRCGHDRPQLVVAVRAGDCLPAQNGRPRRTAG
jgi:hypothetical protein